MTAKKQTVTVYMFKDCTDHTATIYPVDTSRTDVVVTEEKNMPSGFKWSLENSTTFMVTLPKKHDKGYHESYITVDIIEREKQND